MLAEDDSYYSQNNVIDLTNNNSPQNIILMTIYSIMEEKIFYFACGLLHPSNKCFHSCYKSQEINSFS